ncbi:MAG: hypothetical protein ABIS17_13310 [Casimicrobiaceae bacterium]
MRDAKPGAQRCSRPDESLAPSVRVLGAVLGALFVGCALVVITISAPLTWQPVVGALGIAIVGIDLLASAWRNRRPILAGLLFLP